jgi:hypothetical protein
VLHPRYKTGVEDRDEGDKLIWLQGREGTQTRRRLGDILIPEHAIPFINSLVAVYHKSR